MPKPDFGLNSMALTTGWVFVEIADQYLISQESVMKQKINQKQRILNNLKQC